MPKDTKHTLRREAVRLFAERGYSAVSMRELAEAVGMRQGGIYNHFPSKQALLADLMATHMETLLATLEDALSMAQTPENRLAAFVRNHMAFHLDHPDDVFLAYMEIRSLEPENRAAIVELRNTYEKCLRDILKDGLTAGVFQLADVDVHTRMLLAMLTGATTWYREGGRLKRHEVAMCYLQGAMQSVGAGMERA